ncbi:MAG: beta-lactamase family protein [Treponema sp.]|jgi:CubicO group peptidase (beta-lactamase class C family)|nr:beta-lactamase family protein [Treponema sp.]
MLYTEGKTEVKPAEVGYNGKRLEVLNKHLQGLIDDGEIQCATYCLSRKGKVFAHGAVGKKSFRKDDNTPVQPDSVRYIASITKVFTAVAIMKLVEDGITRLDVPIGEILPQFNTIPFTMPQYQKTIHASITLFHLLTHTSGMHADGGCFENKYQTDYWKMIDDAYKLHDRDKNGEFDWISAALGTIGNGLRVKPGSEGAYCSFGFVLLGAVIEKLTGMSAHKYIEDNISKPLGMKDTIFDLSPDMAKRYIITDEGFENYLNSVINGTNEPEWIGEKLKIPSTGGGLNGTAYDLVRFGNMMLSGGTFDGARILGRKAVEKMTTMAIHNKPDYCWGSNEPDRGYGIGFDMRNGPAYTYSQNTFMHEGAGACSMNIDPKEEFVAAWFVPFSKEGWFSRALYNVQSIIWSGIV